MPLALTSASDAAASGLTSAAVGGWVLAALIVLEGVKLTRDLFVKKEQHTTRIAEQPVIVQAAPTHIDRETFAHSIDAITKTTDDLYRIVHGKERGLREEFDSHITALRNEVGITRRDLAGLSAMTEEQNKQLSEIRADIKDLLSRPQRTPAH